MEIIQKRFYGQPKFKKPKFLNNKTQIGTAVFLRRCVCKIYECDGFIYIYHRDWFSDWISKEKAFKFGIIDKFDSRFIYNDNFGAVVLRNECIFKFYKSALKKSMPKTRLKLIQDFAKMINVDWTDLSHWEWEDFFEQVIDVIKETKNDICD